MRDKNCVDLLNANDQEEFFELRSSTYKSQYGSNVDVNALKWNHWDERFANLGVFHNGKLVSLLRVVFIDDPEEYKKILLYDFNSSDLVMPVAILNRAATHADHATKGFHSLLRLHALRLLKQMNVEWVLGTLLKDSRRVTQMKEMGYEFQENPVPWNGFLKSSSPPLVARLNLEHNYERAEKRLLLSAEPLLNIYPARYNAVEILSRLAEAPKRKMSPS